MIMGSQDFPSSWGRSFVVNKVGIILINACIYFRGDVNSWARVTNEIPNISNPPPLQGKNDDSSVFKITKI